MREEGFRKFSALGDTVKALDLMAGNGEAEIRCGKGEDLANARSGSDQPGHQEEKRLSSPGDLGQAMVEALIVRQPDRAPDPIEDRGEHRPALLRLEEPRQGIG